MTDIDITIIDQRLSEIRDELIRSNNLKETKNELLIKSIDSQNRAAATMYLLGTKLLDATIFTENAQAIISANPYLKVPPDMVGTDNSLIDNFHKKAGIKTESTPTVEAGIITPLKATMLNETDEERNRRMMIERNFKRFVGDPETRRCCVDMKPDCPNPTNWESGKKDGLYFCDDHVEAAAAIAELKDNLNPGGDDGN